MKTIKIFQFYQISFTPSQILLPDGVSPPACHPPSSVIVWRPLISKALGPLSPHTEALFGDGYLLAAGDAIDDSDRQRVKEISSGYLTPSEELWSGSFWIILKPKKCENAVKKKLKFGSFYGGNKTRKIPKNHSCSSKIASFLRFVNTMHANFQLQLAPITILS